MCASSGLWSNSGAAPLNLQAPKYILTCRSWNLLFWYAQRGAPLNSLSLWPYAGDASFGRSSRFVSIQAHFKGEILLFFSFIFYFLPVGSDVESFHRSISLAKFAGLCST